MTEFFKSHPWAWQYCLPAILFLVFAPGWGFTLYLLIACSVCVFDAELNGRKPLYDLSAFGLALRMVSFAAGCIWCVVLAEAMFEERPQIWIPVGIVLASAYLVFVIGVERLHRDQAVRNRT